MKQEIIAWLTCDIISLSLETLSDNFNQHSAHMNIFQNCTSSIVNTTLFNASERELLQIKQCVGQMTRSCEDSSMLVLKFIRLTMADAAALLPYFPNMKIVHLVRDPRAVIVSRDQLTAKGPEATVPEFCSRMRQNLRETTRLMLEDRSRVTVMHYEDMAETPLAEAKNLYSALGINFTGTIELYIKSLTEASLETCEFCIERKNSSLVAAAWRNKIQPSTNTVINSECGDVMNVLGYIQLASSELQNQTLQCRIHQNTDDILASYDIK